MPWTAVSRRADKIDPTGHQNSGQRLVSRSATVDKCSTPAGSMDAGVAPVVHELQTPPRPEDAFGRLASWPHAAFFDSARRHATLGRYSYITADPTEWFVRRAGGDPLNDWRQAYRLPAVSRVEGLPPWQGGAAGVIGYEIGHTLERLPPTRYDEFATPVLAAGVYDWVLAYDHSLNRAWLIAHGARASERIESALALLEAEPAPRGRHVPPPLRRVQLAPQHDHDGVLSDFSRDEYLRAVAQVVEHLRAGDAFQVNLSQRLLLPDVEDPIGSYLRLRERNPAPFGGYFDGGDWQVASASPERFLCVHDRLIETRPIKGTRPRGDDERRDALLANELVDSEKERAENVMIVDLLRNDLSRVAEDASVCVPELFAVERYEHVQHLVSVVQARLRKGADLIDLLRATLPGGSITGAPKVSAQKIIATLEPTARGPYCGSMFWQGFPEPDGSQAMDSSILIRTRTHARGWIQAPVGGGVTIRSDPEQEYEETWHKAAGLIDRAAL